MHPYCTSYKAQSEWQCTPLQYLDQLGPKLLVKGNCSLHFFDGHLGGQSQCI